MPAKTVPDKGELVVCTVVKAKGFGAFVRLEEYPGTEGFIHIKEVASGWVKNIRNHVKEGQKIVCKVMEVDTAKGYIDLSLKRVNEHQRREKTQQWKNEHKAEKLFHMVADRIGKSADDCWKEFGNAIVKKYGSMYEAFEEVAYDNDVLEKDGLSGEWVSTFKDVANENISIPFVNITGYAEMFSPDRDGIKHIRNALKEIECQRDETSVTVKYVSAPIYRIDVTSPDYKTAEKALKECAEKGVEYIKKHGGTGVFKRKIK